MKLKLNNSLRAALLACYAIAAPVATTVTTGAIVAGAAALTLAPQAMAEEEASADDTVVSDDVTVVYDYTITDKDIAAEAVASVAGDTIEMNLVTSTSYLAYLPDAKYTAVTYAGDIYVTSWDIDNGYSGNADLSATYYFTGDITGSGDITFYCYSSNAASTYMLYEFTGDVSKYEGDITSTVRADKSYSGGLSLTFSGETSEAASGKGNISLAGTTEETLTYNFTTSATIANESIATWNATFTGGADYTLSSDTTVRNILTISEDSTVTLSADNTLTLSDDASLAGAGTLVIDGALTIGSIEEAEQGFTIVNNGTLSLSGSTLAFSTGTIEFKEDGSISSSSISNVSMEDVDLTVGSNTVTIADSDLGDITIGTGSLTFEGTNTFDRLLYSGSNGSTITLADGANVTASFESVTGANSTFVQHSTFVLGEGSLLTLDEAIWVGYGATITISAATDATTGVMSLDGLIVGYSGGSTTKGTVTVNSGATLQITGDTFTSTATSSSSFVVSGAAGTSYLNIYGTVESNVGVSVLNGTGYLNVYSGGELILNSGLMAANASGTGALNLNVYSGGTLTLGNQTDETVTDYSDIIAVTMANGSTITDNGTEGGVSVATTLTYAAGATVNFVGSAADEEAGIEAGSLTMATAVTNATTDDEGVVTASTLSAAIAGDVTFSAGAELVEATVAEGATLTLSDDAAIGTTTVTGAVVVAGDAVLTGDTITGEGTVTAGALSMTGATVAFGEDGELKVNSLTNATVTDATLNVDNDEQDVVTITNSSLIATTVQLNADGASLVLSGVTISADTTFGTFATDTTDTEDTEDTDISLLSLAGDSDGDSTSLTIQNSTLEANTTDNMTIADGDISYTIDLGCDSYDNVILEGALTINLELTVDETYALIMAKELAKDTGDVFTFTIEGVTDVDLVDSVTITITGTYLGEELIYTVTEFETISLDSDGNLAMTVAANNVPEPSTATLSLLALAGLLARRRRKA